MKIESRLPGSLPSGSTVWRVTCLKIGYLALCEDGARQRSNQAPACGARAIRYGVVSRLMIVAKTMARNDVSGKIAVVCSVAASRSSPGRRRTQPTWARQTPEAIGVFNQCKRTPFAGTVFACDLPGCLQHCLSGLSPKNLMCNTVR